MIRFYYKLNNLRYQNLAAVGEIARRIRLHEYNSILPCDSSFSFEPTINCPGKSRPKCSTRKTLKNTEKSKMGAALTTLGGVLSVAGIGMMLNSLDVSAVSLGPGILLWIKLAPAITGNTVEKVHLSGWVCMLGTKD